MLRAPYVLLALAACVDPNREPLNEGDLSWEPCPLRFDGKGPPSQCVTTEMPLRWSDPSGEQIDLFAQRWLAGKDSSRAIWMLPGGPGQSGAVYESYVKDLARELPDTDIYLFEHRGVGRSTRLSCPEEESPSSEDGIDVSLSEWPSCLASVGSEWGDDLSAFSSVEAAHDLAEWVSLANSDQQTFVYGGSYGTTLAHRFLQRYPDRVDGVILDSIAIDVDHRVYDTEYDAVGRELLALCAEDKRCSKDLGDDPVQTALDAIAFVRDGGCDIVDEATLRNGAGAFLADASLRGFAPALFSRSLRCSEGDKADLERLIQLFVDREPHYTETLYSPVLFRNIELSEQWPEPWPELAALEEADAQTAFSFSIGPSSRPLLDLWPRYPWDPESDGALAVTDAPILMLQGGLDPQTPAHRTDAARAALDGPGQHFVFFPQGAHVLLGSTPGRGGDCATRLLADFLDDPLASPDTSCVETIDPVDFDGQPLTSTVLMGGCSRYGRGCGGGRAGLPAAALLALVWATRSARTGPKRRAAQ